MSSLFAMGCLLLVCTPARVAIVLLEEREFLFLVVGII